MASVEGAPPKSFSCFSSEWGDLLLQTNFLAVRTSLGHPSIKSFSDQTYHLGPKITHREGAPRGVLPYQVVRGLAPKFASEIRVRAPNSAPINPPPPPEGFKTFLLVAL